MNFSYLPLCIAVLADGVAELSRISTAKMLIETDFAEKADVLLQTCEAVVRAAKLASALHAACEIERRVSRQMKHSFAMLFKGLVGEDLRSS